MSRSLICLNFLWIRSGTSAVPLTDQPPERQTNPGFSHLASALMAMEDFNAKKSQVVPELEELSNCTVKFDLNTSLFFDTGSVTHQASRSLVDSGEIPCAIAGPFNDFPALELSTLAQAVRIPLVAHRAVNLRVTWENYSPFSHCTFPSPLTLMAEAVSYLQFIGRTDYISLFYTLSDTGTQINEVFTLNMDERGITSFSQSFEDTFRSSRQILPTMRKLKERGYRTILTYMEYATVEFPIIADAAEELGMNNGDYLWMWHGFIDPAHLYSDNPNITKLLQGSVWPGPAEQHFLFPEDPFLASWHSKDDEFVDLVNSMNPIQPGEPGYFVATDGYFQRAYPEYGTGYIYDAVMSLGELKLMFALSSLTATFQGLEHVRLRRKMILLALRHMYVVSAPPDFRGQRALSTLGQSLIFYRGAEHLGLLSGLSLIFCLQVGILCSP